MGSKRMALMYQQIELGKQIWFAPKESKNNQKSITLLENGREYFRNHFIEEATELTIYEFLEIIDAFDYVKKKTRKYKKH